MSSGKHMICDIKNVTNHILLNSPEKIMTLLDDICNKYNYTVIQKIQHIFQPQGFTALYLLSESHISIHTFPENGYAAIDIYTCRQYPDNKVYLEIYNYLLDQFQSKSDSYHLIIDRKFTS